MLTFLQVTHLGPHFLLRFGAVLATRTRLLLRPR
jgi:hypothetical protein